MAIGKSQSLFQMEIRRTMIHKYINNDYYIVIDGNSGAVHQIDEEIYEVLDILEKNFSDIELRKIAEHRVSDENFTEGFSETENLILRNIEIKKNNVREILEELFSLIREGSLFSQDVFEEVAHILKKQQSVLKAICLHVAHSCNMDCGYCFAGKGEYHGEAQIMSWETGKKALDFLYENSGNRQNLEVDFFGGEPLLNWDIVKKLVHYGRSLEKKGDKKFRFTLTTNGLMLSEDIIKFCEEEMSNVVISLDGRKEINDRMRRTKQGKGTYDMIIPSFRKLAKHMKDRQYYMRGTYTAYNKDFSKDIIHMADLGFRELSMEPVVCSSAEDYALREEDIPELFEEYDRLALEMIKRKKENRGFNFYHFNIDLEGGPCAAKRISGCGVGTEYLAVTPEGKLYPCHQFVGKEEFLLGDLTQGIVHKDILKTFEECNIYSRKECRDCFAKLYCSGGCSANAYNANGKIDTVHEFSCRLHRKRIECAIMLKMALL